MNRKRALLFLPSVNGLPGAGTRHVERLRREAPGLEWIQCAHRRDFLRELPGAVAAIVWAFPEEWSEQAASLRILATPAAGKDWIAIRPRSGLTVSFGSFHGELMAETVLGLMLAFTRGIKASLDRRSEAWPREEIGATMRQLRGSHAVILGFGHIGKWIGRLLSPLGVRMTGVNRNDMTRPEYFSPHDRVVPVLALDAALPEADHLLLVLPGDSGSSGIIDARRLKLLPRHAYLYNVGRGNAVVMPDLAAALEAGTLSGAALDVFPEEPLPEDAAIRRCPQVIVMPHVSAFAPTYIDLYLDEFLPRLKAGMPDAKGNA